VITVADLYREVTGMRSETLTKLATIETRDAMTSMMQTDHESRLRVLERFRYTLLGASLLAGSAAGIIASLLTTKGH
jgi:hypothetical protein